MPTVFPRDDKHRLINSTAQLKKRTRLLIAKAGLLGLTLLILVGTGIFVKAFLESPPDLFRFQSVAKPGTTLQVVISEFGKPDSDTGFIQNTRTATYETSYDSGKFREPRICELTLDAENRIIELEVKLKPVAE